jgi:hypothetical protein
MTLNDIKKIIKKYFPIIKDKYKVNKVGIFGSFAVGEQKKNSDIDVLVEFSGPVTFFKFTELKDFLEEKMGRKVDLVTKNALKPIIKDSILNSTIYI